MPVGRTPRPPVGLAEPDRTASDALRRESGVGAGVWRARTGSLRGRAARRPGQASGLPPGLPDSLADLPGCITVFPDRRARRPPGFPGNLRTEPGSLPVAGQPPDPDQGAGTRTELGRRHVGSRSATPCPARACCGDCASRPIRVPGEACVSPWSHGERRSPHRPAGSRGGRRREERRCPRECAAPRRRPAPPGRASKGSSGLPAIRPPRGRASAARHPGTGPPAMPEADRSPPCAHVRPFVLRTLPTSYIDRPAQTRRPARRIPKTEALRETFPRSLPGPPRL